MKRLAVATVLLACGAPPSDLNGGLTPPAASGQLGLVRTVSWPGGGRELTVRVQSDTGEPIVDDVSSGFSLDLDFSDAGDLQLDVTQLPLAVGYTALLVAPAATAGDRAVLVAELEQFVGSRPADESIAVFAWLNRVEQVSNFTRDRARLLDAVGVFAALPPPEIPETASDAVLAVENEAFDVGGKAPRLMRAVVVATADELEIGSRALPVLVGVDGASERIDAFAATSHYRVAACGSTTGTTGTVRVEGMAGELPFSFAETLPEEVGASCDPTLIGPGLRNYPQRIELVLDADQRTVYDQRVADLSKADFALSIGLWPDAPQIEATAHLRGRGTLGCIRKSYTVRLKGPGRHVLPGARTDEFYLLSMCADDRYVQQFTANQIMQELGLFPLKFGLVEVTLDGVSQGVYLLLEKTREELVRDNARVRSVMRRRFNPPDDVWEVKYATGSRVDAIEAYDAVLQDASSAADTVDVGQHLRFLALMTAWENGDYVDEVWVTSTDRLRANAAVTDWFQLMGWDNDDLFSACHHDGNYALVDENELVYCAEARLEKLLLSDADTYDQYVEILDELLTDLVAPERFDQAVEATAADILPFFERPEICEAMVRLIADNPAAVDPVEAQRDVRAKLDDLAAQYRARHAVLSGRIQSYRAQN